MLVTVTATFDIPHEEFSVHTIAQASEYITNKMHENGAMCVQLQDITRGEVDHDQYDPTLDSHD